MSPVRICLFLITKSFCTVVAVTSYFFIEQVTFWWKPRLGQMQGPKLKDRGAGWGPPTGLQVRRCIREETRIAQGPQHSAGRTETDPRPQHLRSGWFNGIVSTGLANILPKVWALFLGTKFPVKTEAKVWDPRQPCRTFILDCYVSMEWPDAEETSIQKLWRGKGKLGQSERLGLT